jgi:ribosomal protein L16 Arg81 hydroxylase
MLTLKLADFSLEHFLAHYWQQKPVVIRQGFENFAGIDLSLIAVQRSPGVADECAAQFLVDQMVGQTAQHVAGERFDFGPACQGAVLALCDHERLDHALLRDWLNQPQFVDALTQWVNDGYWYFEE